MMSIKRNFTLIELLVVISIIMILISLLLPALRQAKEISRKIACVSNLKQVYMASLNYANDNDGYLTYQNVVTGNQANDPQYWTAYYLGIQKTDTRGTVMACPADDREKLIRSNGWRSSYADNTEGAFKMSSSPGVKLSSIRRPTQKFLWADAFNRYYISRWNQTFYMLHGKGCNMVFADGSAKWIDFGLPHLYKVPDDGGSFGRPFSTNSNDYPW